MEKGYLRKYLSMEEGYWWFLARRHFIKGLLKRFPNNFRILDMGCSGGILLEELIGMGFKNVHGIDISSESVAACRERGLRNVSIADAQETGYPDENFDVIICSDILEHIKDEDRAIDEWRRILRKKGFLFCFVPAFRFLWGPADITNMHFRRYSKKDLTEAFHRSGLQVEWASYWNFSLFLPTAFIRLVQRLFPEKNRTRDELFNLGFINSILSGLLKAENMVIAAGNRVPAGTSVFAVIRKS